MNHYNTVRMRCRLCLASQARRVPYRWYETILALLLLRPYRCCHCSARFLGLIRLSSRTGMRGPHRSADLPGRADKAQKPTDPRRPLPGE